MCEVKIKWSRSKKIAYTKSQIMKPEDDAVLFDQRFQIMTILKLDYQGMPISEKKSSLTVVIDEKEIGMCEFLMTDFNLAEYKTHRL